MTKKRKPLRHDEDGKEITLDLHGYRVREAVSVADQVVRDAWEAGYESVKLIHGAPDVTTREQADSGGRGAIKVELRDRLARGDWSAHVQPDPPDGVRIEDGAATVKLRPNPTPSKDRVSGKGLPKPKKQSYFRGRQVWAAAKEAVDREHPVLAAGEGRFPELVGRCRAMLTREKLLAGWLEKTRRRNADHEGNKTYWRKHRRWLKTSTQTQTMLAELRLLVEGLAGPVDSQSGPKLA